MKSRPRMNPRLRPWLITAAIVTLVIATPILLEPLRRARDRRAKDRLIGNLTRRCWVCGAPTSAGSMMCAEHAPRVGISTEYEARVASPSASSVPRSPTSPVLGDATSDSTTTALHGERDA